MAENIIATDDIEQIIRTIRGYNVLLDRDLAKLYGVETRTLNQAVRRNIERFPQDFMFSLTRKEIMNLSQIVTSSSIKHAPNVFAFIEQGVAMLSSVLRSKQAIQVNIRIMRIFVQLKGMHAAHRQLTHNLNQLERKIEKHDKEINVIFQAIRALMSPPEKKQRKIGFEREKE